MQYALLVGIPTSTSILATGVCSWNLHRFLRTMHANFDRLEKSMAEAESNTTPPQSAFL